MISTRMEAGVWTTADIRAWIQTLGPTAEKQRATIQYLMEHAKGDGMSREDRIVCGQALRLLGSQGAAGERPAG